MRKLMIGIDLHIERPQICYYDLTTKQSGTFPMRIGNAHVSLAELFPGDGAADRASARTIADILKEVFLTSGIRDTAREINGIMITVRTLDKPMVDLIRAVYEHLGIPKNRAYMQDYCESFFYYMAYQKRELWGRNAALFDFNGDRVTYYRLAIRDNVRPRIARTAAGGSRELAADAQTRDVQLAEFAQEQLRNELFSSIFLTGNGFDAAWAEASSKVLCRGGRKVFTEDGLFARGARNAVRERLEERQIRGVTYESGGLVRYQIGIRTEADGKIVIHPLIAGGTHWYNASGDCELLLGGEKALTFTVTGIDNGGKYQTKMELPGIPDRPERTTRLHLHIEYEAAGRCVITVEDLGFGELFPASGLTWREVLGDMT